MYFDGRIKDGMVTNTVTRTQHFAHVFDIIYQQKCQDMNQNQYIVPLIFDEQDFKIITLLPLG